MKAIFITSVREGDKPGTVDLREVETPEPTPEEVRIKVAYGSICGSDTHILGGDLGQMVEGTRAGLPMRTGHEMSGVIDKVGERAAALGFTTGQRVVGNYARYCHSCAACASGKPNLCDNLVYQCNTMAEYVCFEAAQVHPIPDTLTLRRAALVEPLTIAMGAVEAVNVRLGKTVAIVGAGGLGLMAVQLARLSGATHVAVFELVEEKRRLALETGADAAYDPRDEDAAQRALAACGGSGFDCVLEGTGSTAAAGSTLPLIARDGQAVYFSMYGSNPILNVNLHDDFYWNQKHLHGLFMGANLFPRAIRVATRMNLDALIQREHALEDFQSAYADALSGRFAKVLIRFDGAQ